MPHSFSQTASLTCPQCGRAFSAEVWLIVDADERPDLLARIRAGTLHDVTCPHCGHQGQVDAPLLLLRPGATPPLLFSPAQGTTPEEDRQQAAGLVGLLQERMGPAWRDEWLAQGLPGVPRPLLPAAMSDDPEAYRQLEEAARELVERLLAADPFMAGLQALLEADSMTALLQAAQDHPILLTAEAEARIRQGAENARRAGQEEIARAMEERYRALRQTVQAAQESGLTLEQAIEMTAQVEKAVRSGDVDRRLALAQTLQDFIQADTWDESRRILEAHPELLTDEADALLGQLLQAAQAQGDEDARHILEEHRALLRRCREVGIERAFAELGGPPIPPEFQADLRRAQEGVARYGQTGDPAALNQAIAAWERILNHPAFPRADERFRLAAWNGAGGAYLRRYEATGHLPDLNRAMALWQEAIARTPEGSPDWATMQANLGVALSTRFEALGQVADLDAAIAAYEKALAVFTPEAFPDYTLTAALPLIHLLMRRRGENDMERVAAAGARAVPAWQYLYFESLHESRKQRHLRRAQGLWANYAFALARLGRAGEAVAVLETGRARQLAETFRARQALETLQSPALAGAWRAVKEAESRYHHAPEAKRPAAEADLARRRQEYYARLREHFPDYFAEPTFADVQAALTPPPAPSPLPRSGRGEGVGGWGEASALVYLLATPAGGLALVVTAAGVQAVDLPDLTEAALNGWLVKTDEAGQNVIGGYLPAQLAVSAWMSDALEDLLPALGRALQPLVEALTPSPQLPSPLPNLGEGKGVLPQVAGVGVRAITLIPTGRLALLPLHAARLPDGSHLLDHFAITYAPSAQALQAARREAEARQEAPFFLAGVGNPLPPPEALRDLHRELQEAVAALPDQERIRPLRQELLRLTELPTAQLRHEGFLLRRLILRLSEDLGEPVQRLLDLSRRWPLSLRYARAELQSVVDLLPPEAADPLYEQEATLRALLERLPHATTVHLSCHGVFQADDSLQSGLLLVDEEGKEARLTLRDLFAGESTALRAARLVVLSACQTAVSDFRNLPEEAIGLPAGFLQAGVPAVIGTLWSVDDAATALLVTRTYEYMLQERLSPPQAVRQAQVWLRDLTNADLEAYLTHHEAIARARLESGRRMPFTLLEELLVKVITTGDPQARPYADPYFWAPFTFTGAGEVR